MSAGAGANSIVCPEHSIGGREPLLETLLSSDRARLHICSFLDAREHGRLQKTDKKIQSLLMDDHIAFKAVLESRFPVKGVADLSKESLPRLKALYRRGVIADKRGFEIFELKTYVEVAKSTGARSLVEFYHDRGIFLNPRSLVDGDIESLDGFAGVNLDEQIKYVFMKNTRNPTFSLSRHVRNPLLYKKEPIPDNSPLTLSMRDAFAFVTGYLNQKLDASAPKDLAYRGKAIRMVGLKPDESDPRAIIYHVICNATFRILGSMPYPPRIYRHSAVIKKYDESWMCLILYVLEQNGRIYSYGCGAEDTYWVQA